MSVYFINGAGLTKVGTSRDPVARLRAIQRGVPVDLTLLWSVPGGPLLEAAIHAEMSDEGLHVHREWFRRVATSSEAQSWVVRGRRRLEDATDDGAASLRADIDHKLALADQAVFGSRSRERAVEAVWPLLRRLTAARGTAAAEDLWARAVAVEVGWKPSQAVADAGPREAEAAVAGAADAPPWAADGSTLIR